MRILSEEDITYALENFDVKSVKELSEELKTTKYQLYMLFVQHHKIKPNYSRDWSDEEIEFLKQNFNKLSRTKLALELNRKEYDIRLKIYELGLVNINTKKTYQNDKTKTIAKFEEDWTEEENRYLCFHVNRLSLNEIAEFLNCNKHAVEMQIKKLGLKRLGNKGSAYSKVYKEFSKEEVKFLINNFGKIDLPNIMKAMPDKTDSQIKRLAVDLKLGTKEQIKGYFRNFKPFLGECDVL